MQTLPAEQNRLLKAMNEIDAQERAGVIPLRSNVNLGLIFAIWILTTVLSAISISQGRPNDLISLGGFVLIATISFALAYYNKNFGFYLSAIMAIVGNIYSTVAFTQTSDLATLFNAITVFIVANQFFMRGYIFASIIVIAKILVIYFIRDTNTPLEAIFAQVITILTVGIIPVLMLSISKVSIRAKKQEIRAEILSLQNQDLISSWGPLFERGAAPTSAVPTTVIQTTTTTTPPQAPTQPPVEPPTPANGAIYQSQYTGQ